MWASEQILDWYVSDAERLTLPWQGAEKKAA